MRQAHLGRVREGQWSKHHCRRQGRDRHTWAGAGQDRGAEMSGAWMELWEHTEKGAFGEFAGETAQEQQDLLSVMGDEKKKFPVKSNFDTSSFIAGINSDTLTCL